MKADMPSWNSPSHPRSRTCARCQRPPEQTGPLFCETCHPLVRREPLVQEVIAAFRVYHDALGGSLITEGDALDDMVDAVQKLARFKP